jgi:hypothetical protein
MSRYTVAEYTGSWCQSVRAPCLEAGDKIRIADSADSREHGDFVRALKTQGMTLEFRRYYTRLKCDEFVVVKGDINSGFKGV